jgi:hypothetical protein
MMQAIAEARPIVKKAEDAKAANRPAAEIDALMTQARLPYEQARSKAERLILSAESTNKDTAQYQAAAIELLASLPALETGGKVKGVPSENDLKGMSKFQLRRSGNDAFNAESYDAAEAYYNELIERCRKEGDDAGGVEATRLLGQADYMWGLTLARSKQAAANDRLVKAQELFRSLLKDAKGEDRAQIYRYLVSIAAFRGGETPKEQQEAYNNLIATLQEAIDAGVEPDQNRSRLGDAYNNAEDFRSAADTYAKVKAADGKPDFKAQALQCAMLINYWNQTPRPPDNQSLLVQDKSVIDAFYAAAEKEASRLRAAQPDNPPPGSQPDNRAPGAQFEHPADKIIHDALAYKLEFAWITYDRLKVQGEVEALRMIEEVKTAADGKHWSDLATRARSKKVRILMDKKEVQKAKEDLISLLKEDPASAQNVAMDALDDFETKYAAYRPDPTKKKELEEVARLAEDVARALDEHHVPDTQRSEAEQKLVKEYFKVRHARTLNWLGQYDEAIKKLTPYYVPPSDTNKDGKIDKNDNFTHNQDLLVELGEALYAAKQYEKAAACLDQVVGMEPLWGKEIWWRALLGKCECQLAIGERNPATTKKKLNAWVDDYRNDPHKALPAWLESRHTALNREYDRLIGDKPQTTDASDRPAGSKDKGDAGPNMGQQVLMILVGGLIAMVAISVIVVVLTRRQMKARAMARREEAALAAMRRRPATARKQPGRK